MYEKELFKNYRFGYGGITYCSCKEEVSQIEVSVVKKMSINLDIFFCKKLLKSIFNPLMLILGRPNLMKI